jgi:MoaF C-terminal domain/MoaF N-terminal domain
LTDNEHRSNEHIIKSHIDRNQPPVANTVSHQRGPIMSDHQHATFMQVGDFVTNFGGNELEHSEALSGKSFGVHFEYGRVIRYSFQPNQKMTWQVIRPTCPNSAVSTPCSESYRASCLRDGFYLVDFVEHRRPIKTWSLIIDFHQNIVTLVMASMPNKEETFKPMFQRVIDQELLTPMHHEISHGAIDQDFTEHTRRHQPTKELIGKRVRYQYGPNDAYEHIYLNQQFYTWHCLQGPESGLADTDICRYYKLDEELYLFVWLEKVIPTIGVILVDFQKKKTTGKIFGYKGDDFGATCNTPVGAYLTLFNETRQDNEPRR